MTGLLLRPLWLLALPGIAALALWVWRRRSAAEWEALIAPPVMERLRALGLVAPAARGRAAMLPFAAAAGLALALSAPARWREGGQALARMDPLILMIDMSPSVAGTVLLPDAQAAAAQALQLADGRPVGILLYAADAYVASAPSSDARALESLIAVLGPEVMPVGGSRPDIALGSARELFADKAADSPGLGGSDLILISDGGGAGSRRSIEEAERLRAEGARVWALGLDRPGMPPGATLPDLEALRHLAAVGGGAFAEARSPRPLLERIAADAPRRLADSGYAPLVLDDLGRWLLLPALIPALLLFRRRART